MIKEYRANEMDLPSPWYNVFREMASDTTHCAAGRFIKAPSLIMEYVR